MLSFLISNIVQAQSVVEQNQSNNIRRALEQCYKETGVLKPDYQAKVKSPPKQSDLSILNDCLATKGFPIKNSEDESKSE